MDMTLRIVLLMVSVLFLAFVLLRVRHGRYLLKYSLIWIVLSLIGVVSAVFPDWLYFAAHLLGFSVPSNFVYFALIGVLLIANLILCGILSRQETMIKSIVQEVSILKSKQGDGFQAVEDADTDADMGQA